MEKKLNYFKIHEVLAVKKHSIPVQMQAIQFVDPKPGQYAATDRGIKFPKRERGQKFLVRYTELKEVML